MAVAENLEPFLRLPMKQEPYYLDSVLGPQILGNSHMYQQSLAFIVTSFELAVLCPIRGSHKHEDDSTDYD